MKAIKIKMKPGCNYSNNLTEKEQWIAYLKGCNNKLLEKIKKENKYIEKLDNILEKYWTEETME